MLYWIYALPLKTILFLMCTAICLWGFLNGRRLIQKWEIVNGILLAVSLLAILFITLHRTPGTHTAVLHLFSSLAAAKERPELYRSMLMNMFLFFPLGLTLSNALPPKMSMWRRIALTTFLCCVISAGIEFAQCFLFLGVAEIDDVICNTLGSFFGACSLLIAHLIQKWQNHSNR